MPQLYRMTSYCTASYREQWHSGIIFSMFAIYQSLPTFVQDIIFNFYYNAQLFKVMFVYNNIKLVCKPRV